MFYKFPADRDAASTEGQPVHTTQDTRGVILLDDAQVDPAARPDGGSLSECPPQEILLAFDPFCNPANTGVLLDESDQEVFGNTGWVCAEPPVPPCQDYAPDPDQPDGQSAHTTGRSAAQSIFSALQWYVAYGAILLCS